MIELEAGQFDRVSPVVSGLRGFVHLNAVINRDHPGRVFVDRAENPELVLIWTRWGYYYLAGQAFDEGVTESLSELLSQTLIPDSVAGGERDLVLIPYPDSWQARVGTILPQRETIKLFRRTFALNQSVPASWCGVHDQLPDGFRLARIDADLVSQIDGLLATWDSIEGFLENGFGFCILDRDVVVSECYTAFVSDGCVEISVSTAPSYRRQGLAFYVAGAFIGHCSKNGMTPNWECWWDNEPSCALAKKLGYVAEEDHVAIYWHEDE